MVSTDKRDLGEEETPRHDDVTRLLRAWHDGEPEALRELLDRVLRELRGMAQGHLGRERPGHTYQPTDLVQEVYLRLVGRPVQEFGSRSEFFAFATRLMRQVLIDHARTKLRAKRGGDAARVPIEDLFDLHETADLDPETILAVSEAVTRLGEQSARQRQVVELRYFVGLTVPEIADALDLGRATVERDWAVARRWLARELSAGTARAVRLDLQDA